LVALLAVAIANSPTIGQKKGMELLLLVAAHANRNNNKWHHLKSHLVSTSSGQALKSKSEDKVTDEDEVSIYISMRFSDSTGAQRAVVTTSHCSYIFELLPRRLRDVRGKR